MSPVPLRPDHDAGGDPALLAAEAALREEVWTALTDATIPLLAALRG